MINSPADVVRWLLVQLGQASDPTATPLQAWPAYVDSEPNQPDNCVTLYDTAGQSDGRAMTDGTLFAHYGFQVRVRGVDFPTGWQKADAIRTALSAVLNQNVVIGTASYRVYCVSKIGQVLRLGKDAPNSKRSLFTLNALVSVNDRASDLIVPTSGVGAALTVPPGTPHLAVPAN